jgi:hypothetical protein
MKPKTPAEILTKLRDTVHKHRKKFVKRNSVCKPENCAGSIANPDGTFSPCSFCQAAPGEPCARETAFSPRFNKDALNGMFKADINNPQKLVRDYRDVAFLLWALGLLDGDRLVGPSPTNVADGQNGDAPSSEESRVVWFDLPEGVQRSEFEVFISALNNLIVSKFAMPKEPLKPSDD